jgi:cytochrome c oxidase assembly protein subunit 15
MPFDLSAAPAGRLATQPYRHVAIWLFVMCFMILVMVALGGATRLTGSGLSIMEWAPIMGALPPLSDTEWQRLFTLYQQIPQYNLLHQGFGLEGFKHIFWLEWTHRLWGRLMGAAFALPLGWFALRRELPRGLWKRLIGLFVLGGLQGAVGWFMVASGFEADSTAVSPYRLVAHLVLALALYSALLWTALDVWQPVPSLAPASRQLRRLSAVLLGMVAVTIIAGGFVAGLKAGFTYNTFPLMDGRLIPDGYAAMHPFARNLTENIPAVQFDHRVLATLTAILALSTVAIGLASRPGTGITRALTAIAVVVAVQYTLGVATLIYVVPVSLATLHQATAVLLLTAVLVLRHTLRRPLSSQATR